MEQNDNGDVKFIYESEEESLEVYDSYDSQHDEPTLNYFSILCVTQLVILAIAVIWGFFRKIFWWNNLKLDSSIFWGIGLAIVFILLSSLMYIFRKRLSFTNLEWIFETLYLPVFGSLKIHQFLILALLSGFCEEALFRGILVKECGVIVSSIIFGCLHTGNKKLIFSAIWITAMGACLGFLYIHTDNLLVTVTAHFINNLVSFIGVSLLARKRKENKIDCPKN